MSLNSGGNKRTETTGKNGIDSIYALTGVTQGKNDGEEIVVKVDEINTLQGNTPTLTGSVYAWNQKGGTSSSSTRNITGVYDLSGATWERTASYTANGHKSLLQYGKSVSYEGEVLKTQSTKYTMVYPFDSTVDNNPTDSTTEGLNSASSANYVTNTKIYGDAVRETSTSSIGETAWENNFSNYVGSRNVFMMKSGSFMDTLNAGRFYFSHTAGSSYFNIGFRPVIIPIT